MIVVRMVSGSSNYDELLEELLQILCGKLKNNLDYCNSGYCYYYGYRGMAEDEDLWMPQMYSYPLQLLSCLN